MKESIFINNFISFMKERYPDMWYKKIHGDEFQKDIADNIFCINGIFMAIEFKVQRDNKISTTIGQLKEMKLVKNSKGIALFIAFDENRGKILIREKRIPYKKYLDTKKTKRFYIQIDWDFEYNTYEDAIELLSALVERK